jgi:hypothetical protein
VSIPISADVDHLNNLVKNPHLDAPVDWSGSITLTQGVSITLTGGGVVQAQYIILYPIVYLWVQLNPKSGGTSGSAIIVGGLPSAILPASQWIGSVLGVCSYFHGSSGVRDIAIPTIRFTGNQIWFVVPGQTGMLGATPAFAVSSSPADSMQFNATYMLV